VEALRRQGTKMLILMNVLVGLLNEAGNQIKQ
jgi:hypothetical protein